MRVWGIELTSCCMHHCAASRILRVGGSRKIDERTRFRSHAYMRGLHRHWQFSGTPEGEKRIATARASSDRSVWALSKGGSNLCMLRFSPVPRAALLVSHSY